MRLIWARERPEHVAHLIAIDTTNTWMESEGHGKSLGEKTISSLRALGWRSPTKESYSPPRYKSGYVGLCNISFVPNQRDCIERRCKLCLKELADLAAAAGV